MRNTYVYMFVVLSCDTVVYRTISQYSKRNSAGKLAAHKLNKERTGQVHEILPSHRLSPREVGLCWQYRAQHAMTNFSYLGVPKLNASIHTASSSGSKMTGTKSELRAAARHALPFSRSYIRITLVVFAASASFPLLMMRYPHVMFGFFFLLFLQSFVICIFLLMLSRHGFIKYLFQEPHSVV
jgi:hypothetical protein